jgi:hypothetical protein
MANLGPKTANSSEKGSHDGTRGEGARRRLREEYFLPVPISTYSNNSAESQQRQRQRQEEEEEEEKEDTPLIFVLPVSVKHVHPEFDAAIAHLLRDPRALLVLATQRIGRDDIPASHESVKQDLMHPVNPPAAVVKLMRRLRRVVGPVAVTRVRILPPLPLALYLELLSLAAVLLDPFPVGVHAPIREALHVGTPVVSAPSLQECTSRHARGITAAFHQEQRQQQQQQRQQQQNALTASAWVTTAEQFADAALKLARQRHHQRQHSAKQQQEEQQDQEEEQQQDQEQQQQSDVDIVLPSYGHLSHGEQLSKFAMKLLGKRFPS